MDAFDKSTIESDGPIKFGVSAEDCFGYLAPNIKGEVDEEFFKNLPILSPALLEMDLFQINKELEDFNLGIDEMEFTLQDALPPWIFCNFFLNLVLAFSFVLLLST